jgi:hypothetical protein
MVARAAAKEAVADGTAGEIKMQPFGARALASFCGIRVQNRGSRQSVRNGMKGATSYQAYQKSRSSSPAGFRKAEGEPIWSEQQC